MTAPIDEFTDPPRGPEEPRRQIAVALAHQFGSDGAPVVVASGVVTSTASVRSERVAS